MKRKPVKLGVRAKRLAERIRVVIFDVMKEGKNCYRYDPTDNDKLERMAIDILLSYGVIRFVRKKKYRHGWRGKGLWWDSRQVFKLGDY